MPPPNDYRPQVFRNPYMPRRGGNPIRGFSQSQQRGNTAFEPTYAMPSPQDAAMGLFNIGLQADSSGNLNPTQDFGGMMGAASSQINSMTRGVRPGQFSSLGKPMGTMYAQNPGFFRSGPGGTAGFGDAVSQRNQTFAEQFKIPDYTGGQQAGSPAAGGGIPNPMRPGYAGPYRPGFTGTTEQQKIQNRAALQEQVDAKRMLGQATGDIPTVRVHYTDTHYAKADRGRNIDDVAPGEGMEKELLTFGELRDGGKGLGIHDYIRESYKPGTKLEAGINISGKYGTGSAEFFVPGGPRKEGLINGRPASEVLQGLANKPGIARAGDRFQPQKSTPAETKAMNTALSKLPMRNPLLKR